MARSYARDVFYVFLGCCITLGFWLGPDLARWFDSNREVESVGRVPARETTRNAAPAVPRAAPPQSASPGRDALIDRRAEILARMAQTCAFWSSRDQDESGQVFRNRACKEMRRYAARTGQTVPAVRGYPAPGASTRRAPARRPSPLGVYVRECTDYKHGSIAYRNCRAEEKQRLKQRCQHHRQREEWQHAGAWCSAAENYAIVD